NSSSNKIQQKILNTSKVRATGKNNRQKKGMIYEITRGKINALKIFPKVFTLEFQKNFLRFFGSRKSEFLEIFQNSGLSFPNFIARPQFRKVYRVCISRKTRNPRFILRTRKMLGKQKFTQKNFTSFRCC